MGLAAESRVDDKWVIDPVTSRKFVTPATSGCSNTAKVFGQAASCIASTEHESHYGSETVGRCQTHEIKPGKGGLEVLRKHRGVLDGPKRGADFLAEKV